MNNVFDDLGCDPEVAISVMERACNLIVERKPQEADALLDEFPQLKAALFAHEPEE